MLHNDNDNSWRDHNMIRMTPRVWHATPLSVAGRAGRMNVLTSTYGPSSKYEVLREYIDISHVGLIGVS